MVRHSRVGLLGHNRRRMQGAPEAVAGLAASALVHGAVEALEED